MDDKSVHISEECWKVIKQLLCEITEKTLRPLYTEIMVLDLAFSVMKRSLPQQRAALDQWLAMAYDNEGIKQDVDKRIQSILKMLNTLDQSNRDQVLAEIARQYTPKNREN